MSTWTSIRKHVMRELHGEGCGGYLARDKSLVIVEDCNFWTHLKTTKDSTEGGFNICSD